MRLKVLEFNHQKLQQNTTEHNRIILQLLRWYCSCKTTVYCL